MTSSTARHRSATGPAFFFFFKLTVFEIVITIEQNRTEVLHSRYGKLLRAADTDCHTFPLFKTIRLPHKRGNRAYAYFIGVYCDWA